MYLFSASTYGLQNATQKGQITVHTNGFSYLAMIKIQVIKWTAGPFIPSEENL